MKCEALVRGLIACALAVGGMRNVAAEDGKVSSPHAAAQAEPKEFGIQDATITVIPATAFRMQYSPYFGTGRTPDLAVYCDNCAGYTAEYYAQVELPAGAVIDSIGVNNATDADAIMGAAIWRRNADGLKSMLYGFSFPPHGWDTDIAGPLGIVVADHVDKELVLQVEQLPSPDFQYFAWVEIHWHREVSVHDGSPTFLDVPSDALGYQHIEALAASGITGGCGGGNFCPDANLTRRQMAIFLAKALGLHWPN